MRKLLEARIRKFLERITNSPRFPGALMLGSMFFFGWAVWAGINGICYLLAHRSLSDVVSGSYLRICSPYFLDSWPGQAAICGIFCVGWFGCGVWLLWEWRKRRATGKARGADRPPSSSSGP